MGRRKPNFYEGWTKEEREFCVKQYFKRRSRGVVRLDDVKRDYWEKYHVVNSKYGNREKCPTSDHIMEWVKTQGKCTESEKPQQTETNKLSGTQWGRKTGENRSIRSDSVDMGEQHQAIKWKQRDMKWNGPRPFNEKPKIEVPVIEGRPGWWYAEYIPPAPAEKELKADKKQILKEKFEEEVLELVESLDAHGHAARASSFVALRGALQRHPVDGLLAKHRATLADQVSRALRRGKDGERKAAAAIAPLLALQVIIKIWPK
ncbi:hypothetical protein PYW08_014475 [Mythimna loreyi]|uniref:Uncharacterized protein n=1 Tax=Mythimna loreyi TaxID=667449 RepID=A0ACC2R4Q0_9NEOP|nr:hypothetical protein PYW08_014475 [Mythimna loreyi]